MREEFELILIGLKPLLLIILFLSLLCVLSYLLGKYAIIIPLLIMLLFTAFFLGLAIRGNK